MAETKIRERTVVVAIDESDHSMHALEWALDTMVVFNELSHDKIILLHAKPTPFTRPALSGPGYILSSELIASINNDEDKEIAVFMDKALQICQGKQVIAEVMVVPGDARDVICETAETLNADFLVIGSHGYGTIKRAVLGSVSDHCAHNVSCPVVIVKKPYKKPDATEDQQQT